MKKSVLPEELAIQIVKEKYALIEEILKKNDVDCWLIFARETSMNPDPVLELVSASDVVWESAFIFTITGGDYRKIAIVGNFDAQAELKKGIWNEVISYTESMRESLVQTIGGINPVKIALNFSKDDVAADGLSHGLFLKLKEMLPQYSDRFTSSASIVRSLRGIKTITELKLITAACELTEKINRKITQMLKPGMTEIEIQELFHGELDYHGVKEAWQRSSCPSVDAGPDKVFGHIGPSELKTSENNTLHNDFGVQFKGYC
ncbi:MAG: M24 family metallopeptidase, partial [Candidatus Hodarchaeales archaeon]